MMPDQMAAPAKQPAADPRWFIWTIVFLVVAGISLASFIMFSGSESWDSSPAIVTHVTKPAAPTTTPQP